MLGAGYAEAFVEFVRSHREWASAAVFILAFGESLVFVSLILPFWAMLVGLGAVIGVGSSDFPVIWIAASFGAGLGDSVSYWIGFRLHNQVARMWPMSRDPGLLARSKTFLDRYGVWAIVLGRFSGPLRATVPFLAGAARMDQILFQIANWLSAFLWALVLLVFGGSIGLLFERFMSLF